MHQNGFHRDLGSCPIQADRPVGASPREGDCYAVLQAQIDRLTDIHATAPVDWELVVQSAETILRDQGKDWSVGVWLTAGLFHTRGLAGLADGIHALRDLVTTYWDDMSPPATRLRGRRNQMQWLLDLLNEQLSRIDVSFVSLPGPLHAALLADWDALDTAWQLHDSDPPAFYGLRASLAHLPTEATNDREPVLEDGASADHNAGHVWTDASTTSERQGFAQGVAVSPASGGTDAADESGSPIKTRTLPPAVSDTTLFAPSADSDPGALADAGLAALRPLLDWCLNECPTLPLLFRLNRVCAWATLVQAPPAVQGLTRLPPPADQVVVGYEQILQGGQAEAALHFAESRLIGHRYWLDLNHTSHAALIRLGATDAAETVAFETRHLLGRLPELTAMTFSDGRPFASAQTLDWLQALDTPGSCHSEGEDVDGVSRLVHRAQTDAAQGRLGDALTALQGAVQCATSGRERFRLRLAQCMLLQRVDTQTDARPLLQSLIHELDAHHLCHWEPALAVETLQLAASVESRYSAPKTWTDGSMLARLASLDLPAAWQLSQSPATT